MLGMGPIHRLFILDFIKATVLAQLCLVFRALYLQIKDKAHAISNLPVI